MIVLNLPKETGTAIWLVHMVLVFTNEPSHVSTLYTGCQNNSNTDGKE